MTMILISNEGYYVIMSQGRMYPANINGINKLKNIFKSEYNQYKFEKMLEEIGLFPNAVKDTFYNDYSTICKKSDSEIFEYLVVKSTTKHLCETEESTATALKILAHLLAKFRDNDNDKTEIPINFEKNYFKAVKNIEDIILFQENNYRYFKYFEDIDLDDFSEDRYLGSPYRIYKKKAHKIKNYLKLIDNKLDYKEFLEKFGLEEKQAFMIFGKYWYYILSQNDDTLYWNVQRCILRFKRSDRYRMRLELYSERTMEFFEKVLFNNSELNSKSNFQFNDLFIWNYEPNWKDRKQNGIWNYNYYRIFGQTSGKYFKKFEEVMKSHHKPRSKINFKTKSLKIKKKKPIKRMMIKN